MDALYTATATATGGRDGRVRSDDGTLDLATSMPKGLGGAGGEGTNPEQLFAAGYSACFGSAARLVAMRQKFNTEGMEITAKVSIGRKGPAFGLAVELQGKFPALTREEAATLMEAAHQVCPYSNATRGNIDVALTVV